jgi:type 1 glutamine amidotransferase
MRTLSFLLALVLAASSAAAQSAKSKIVLIGTNRDHPPTTHEYMAGLKVLDICLRQTPGVETVISNGWPKDPKVFEGANSVVIFLAVGGNFLLGNQDRKKVTDELIGKGVGLVALHWAVEAPAMPARVDVQIKNDGVVARIGGKPVTKDDKLEIVIVNGKPEAKLNGQPVDLTPPVHPYMRILGGFYEPGYSTNPHNTTDVRPADAAHPICRGWKAFNARDEFYYRIRFLPEAKPIVLAALGGSDQTIGWAYERPDGGRSFGFTGCHFHSNFGKPEFRRLITNAILWTAKAEVPADGAAVEIKPADLELPAETPKK